ncbi:hypothetical protein Y1Q_0010302 [Alligator mississippiensis]|uniref:Uncharacterized protein n=1 Tax=Alligator mississippiensis TaxID=8496 RepID=A0A151NM09_ALLMI|nr:hypothetical protein Y1Q_0010302 [Alligator mississippiensis]
MFNGATPVYTNSEKYHPWSPYIYNAKFTVGIRDTAPVRSRWGPILYSESDSKILARSILAGNEEIRCCPGYLCWESFVVNEKHSYLAKAFIGSGLTEKCQCPSLRTKMAQARNEGNIFSWYKCKRESGPLGCGRNFLCNFEMALHVAESLSTPRRPWAIG